MDNIPTFEKAIKILEDLKLETEQRIREERQELAWNEYLRKEEQDPQLSFNFIKKLEKGL